MKPGEVFLNQYLKHRLAKNQALADKMANRVEIRSSRKHLRRAFFALFRYKGKRTVKNIHMYIIEGVRKCQKKKK